MGDNGGRRSEYKLPSIKTLTGSPPLAAGHAARGYPMERPEQQHQHHQQLSAPQISGGHSQYYAHHQHQHQRHHPNPNPHMHAHPYQSRPQSQHQPSSHGQQLHTPTTASRMESAHSGYAQHSSSQSQPQPHDYRGSYSYSSSYTPRSLETPVSAPSPLDHYKQSQPQPHQSHKPHQQQSGYGGGYSSGPHGPYAGEPMLVSPQQASPGASGMARTQPQPQPPPHQHYAHAQSFSHSRSAQVAEPAPPSQSQSAEYLPLSSHPGHSHSYYPQQYSDAFARPPAPRIGPSLGPFVPQQKQHMALVGTGEPYVSHSVSPHAGSVDRTSKQTDATGSLDDDHGSDEDTAGLLQDADDALLKRRKRNAQSAARLRERRKTREQELSTSCASLESQIQRLQEELHEEKRRAKSEKTSKAAAEERAESRKSDLQRAKRTLSATTDGEGDSVMVEAAKEGSKKRSRPLRELDQVRLDDLKSKIETLGKLNQQVCVNLGVLRQEIQRISQAIISQKDRR